MDVRDYYPASGFKNTKAFNDRSFAIGIRSDIVDREARDHEIKARIRIRKRAHVPSVDLYAIADTFEGRIEQGDIPGIARLILFAPDIDACHSARRQPASDRRQYRASAAPHVKHAFVAAQMKVIQNSVPFEKLAAPGRV
jgi:hypothetical protein